MSRRETRARRRRARIEQTKAEFSRVRTDLAAFAGLLERLAASDTPIWPIVEAMSGSNPLDDAERAMVAQTVAPHLAGKTPGSVWRRLAMRSGSAPQVSSLKPGG